MLTIRLIFESFSFALKALKSNILRTILSLLGVTVGIFAIIAVLTMVDSLEKNIKDSLNFLGTGVIYLDKWPYIAEAGQDYKWWEYRRRPNLSVNEFKFLQANLKTQSVISMYADKRNVIVKRGSNSIGQIVLNGAGTGFEKIFEINLEAGRYFTDDELEGGRNIVILGKEVANALFPDVNAIGSDVKVRNLKFKVIAVIKREGQSFMGWSSKDYSIYIPYNSFRKLYQTGTGVWNELESTIGIKGHESDIGLVELENEIKGLLRSKRGLRPRSKDTFSINRPEAIANEISGVFDVC
jgi:putative ABC transport system permease protein